MYFYLCPKKIIFISTVNVWIPNWFGTQTADFSSIPRQVGFWLFRIQTFTVFSKKTNILIYFEREKIFLSILKENTVDSRIPNVRNQNYAKFRKDGRSVIGRLFVQWNQTRSRSKGIWRLKTPFGNWTALRILNIWE